jgi:hypothetical protein
MEGDGMTGQEEWIARLLAAFGGDLAGWTWTGEIRTDDARASICACGQHGLRYLFPWRKEGHEEVITGSVCVVNLPGLAGEQVDRVKTELARRAEVDRELKAEAREGERFQTALQLAEEIRRIWPRVYELEIRRGCGEDLTAGELQLVRRHHDIHEDFRTAIRLRTPAGRIRSLLKLKAELLRGLQPQQEQPHA